MSASVACAHGSLRLRQSPQKQPSSRRAVAQSGFWMAELSQITDPCDGTPRPKFRYGAPVPTHGGFSQCAN
ncbi:hypothetical protein BRAS3843_1530011 [Bradyrhizobium sp. STM 3843]|nr:hypothetical protein BRAS3843_1530011 [Bradyrhizobium sp. STM 3843]